jgi:hypothetical protein
MICVIALVVFGFLGIFSARYRTFAKEAFNCVFRRMTLRACDTGFDKKMKMAVVKRLYKRSKPVAAFTYKHFEAISWVFLIAMFLSMGYSAYALFNLFTTGSCDPAHPENCLFRFNNSNATCDVGNFTIANGTFTEFVGRDCTFCKKMEPVVAQVETQFGMTFQKLEVWYNATNQAVYLAHVNSIARDCGVPTDRMVTPTFWARKTDRFLCGEVSVDKLEQFVKDNR